jgi:glycolate oxidase FAD binding subunit
MDLIHPHTKADVVDALAEASAKRQRLLVVGGRQHIDKGEPCDVDGELWTTQLDRLVAYEPAEMIAVVEVGMRVGELNRLLAEGGQEWPSDAPDDATVGGVLAAAVSSPRRLKLGPVRDSVLEAEMVTGDGRFVKSGARVVKSVTGYDLHKLVVGSLGTLAVIVQVALKVRPLPKARRTLFAPGWLSAGEELLAAVPGAAGAIATPGDVEVRLEGWPEEVEEQTALAREAAPGLRAADDAPFPANRPWEDASVVVEAAVPPSGLEHLPVVAGERWGVLLGVGLMWVGLDEPGEALRELRARVAELGGVAPVIRGPGGLGEATVPAPTVHARLKAAFDPNGVLAPGRFWGGI